ncbi:MAG: protein kinase [Pirellulaceae bacterium]
MNIDDLSATELAKLDAICLQYETDLRKGRAPSIDTIVQHIGGDHSDVLRAELNAVKREIESPVEASAIKPPFQIPSLEQPTLQTSRNGFADDNLTRPSTLPLTIQQPSAVPTASNATLGDVSANSGSSPPVRLPISGERIGPYVIGGTLGEGGMGAVFRAIDTRLDREVAIKVLSVGGEKRQELNDRFEREAKAVAALSHPNIVELFDVGVVNELPYAVMELLRGETLEERLKYGRLTAYEVRFIGAQIADALTTAHEAGVVHRDLKPQNVMILGKRVRPVQQTEGSENGSQSDDELQSNSPASLTPSRFEIATSRQLNDTANVSTRVKVFDFGLSRVSWATIPDSSMDTKAGAIMGTPGYMSPEQVRGEVVTTSTDIFSLGCLLYRAFYGTDPIAGATTAERFASTLAMPPKADESISAEDRDLAVLIQRCLALAPSERPPSAATVASQLRQSVQTIDPVMAQLEAGYDSGEMFRRRFLASLGGGVVGATAGFFSLADPDRELHQIQSLAVLSLDAPSSETAGRGEPVGTRKLAPGEQLSALLVNELSNLSDLSVPPYRALYASSPEEFKKLGAELGVDAFVTGSVTPSRTGKKDYLSIDLKIVSAITGRQLWGHTGIEEVGDNLLEQSLLATDIAQQIDRRLTTTLQKSPAPQRASYQCLIDGKVRAEPDSKVGMEMALNCLNKARKRDPRFVQPVAGVALVSITLASQSDAQSAKKLVEAAIESIETALELDETSVDAQLANAMLRWQIFSRFDEAESELNTLAMLHPYRWQIQHQYGLLLLAIGQQAKAVRVLDDAKKLNRLSMLIKTDTARAAWFSGNAQRAISDAVRVRDGYPDQEAAQRLAKGLLIDIYEQQKQYEKAAKEDPEFESLETYRQEDYFAKRAQRLVDLPYGPFGELMNQTILDSRNHQSMDDAYLAKLADSLSPALPLLLAAHPAFGELRQLDRASDLMPNDLIHSDLIHSATSSQGSAVERPDSLP